MFLHSLLVFWQGWDMVRHYICAICAILAVIYIARYHSSLREELCTLHGKVHDLGTPTCAGLSVFVWQPICLAIISFLMHIGLPWSQSLFLVGLVCAIETCKKG